MFSPRNLRLGLLITCIVGSQTMAETLSPGKDYSSGRVVKKGDNTLAVFWGGGCYEFPKTLQEKLRPYVGKFVNVEYTRISDKESGIFSPDGTSIGSIDKVSVLVDDVDQLPVVVKTQPSKAFFKLAEPVATHVSITNRSTENQDIHLGSAWTRLYQDYEERLVLEPEGHCDDESPYGLPKVQGLRTLAPGQRLEFTVTSQRMAKPGTYQLIYTLSFGAGMLGSQSEVARVTVGKAGNKAEEQQSLKKWLGIADVGQRIELAAELLRFNDTSGTEELLRLLEANEYSKEHYCNGHAFRFAWQHGGSKGEAVMLELIERQTKQDYALRMIEGIYLTPNRLQLVDELLACAKPTYRDISGWVDRPRICDITAAWLMGYTNGSMKFPEGASEDQRDQAVASVKRVLKQNPSVFNVFSESYRRERKSSGEE